MTRTCKNLSCEIVFTTNNRIKLFCSKLCAIYFHGRTDKAKARLQKYNSSEKGVVSRRKFREFRADNIKKSRKKYNDSEKFKLWRKEYEENNPVKMKARSLAKRFLPNRICSVKGCDDKGHRHHPDYNKPLEVIYLCPQHHADIHKQERRSYEQTR